MLQELTDGETEILHSMLDEVHPSHIAALLFSLLEATKGTQGGVARFLRRHTPRDIGFDSPFKMVAELVLEVLLDLIAAEKRPESQPHRVEQSQDHITSVTEVSTRQARTIFKCPAAVRPPVPEDTP
jgi:hypothetical protein